MTINQLSNLAKLLEDASKPNSQSREAKQPQQSVKPSPPKAPKKSQIVKDEEQQASLKAEKKTNKYLKRVTSPAGSLLNKPSASPTNIAQVHKITKLVPKAVGTSLIQALAKGVIKNESTNEDESKEPWQSKFTGKQY